MKPDPHKIVWLPFGYHMPVLLYERRLLADFRPAVGPTYGSRMVANQIRADREGTRIRPWLLKSTWNYKNFHVYLDPQRKFGFQMKIRESSRNFCHAFRNWALKIGPCPVKISDILFRRKVIRREIIRRNVPKFHLSLIDAFIFQQFCVPM